MKTGIGMVLFAALGLFTAGCGGSSDSRCTLSGTFTLSNVTVNTGDAVTFILDNDQNSGNGTALSVQFDWPGGTSPSYGIDISGLPAGSYYYIVSVPAASAVGMGGPNDIGCGSVLDVTLSPATAN